MADVTETHLRPSTAVFFFLALCCGIAEAQITVLQNVTVIDGNGGTPRRNAALVIHGEKIAAITDANARVPKGAAVIELSGKALMPEIINTHGHLGLLKGTKMSAENYTKENIARQLLQYQDYGVGAMLVMGTDRDEIYQWRTESREGTFPGALFYTAGRGFGAPGGVPPLSLGADLVYRPTTPEEARQDIDELATHHPDMVKLWLDDFWGQYPKMKPQIYAAIIDEAHKHGLGVAAHVYHEEDAQRLVDDGVDALAHSVRDAEIPDTLIAEMKSKNVAYIGTMSLDEFATAYADDPSWLSHPFFRHALEPGVYEMITSPQYKKSIQDDKKTQAEIAAQSIEMKNMKKVYDAGILVALGTDSGATPTRAFGFSEHNELQLLVHAGLTPLEAITVATKNGAELLHASGDFGVLRPGLKANFIVLDKDPSEDIRNTESISAVWKSGKKVSTGPHSRSQ